MGNKGILNRSANYVESEHHVHTLSQHQKLHNNSFDLQTIIDILNNFYQEFDGEINYILIILYIPVIIIAVVANILVIVVVYKYRHMRSITNYFVVNLSIADLLVTFICMPIAVSQAVSVIWIYGEFMCKLFYYLQGVAVAASVFTITAMSIDRYFAIRSPIVFRRVFNRKSTIIVIITLWIIAMTIFAPMLKMVTLQSPFEELENITLDGQWSIHNSFEILKLPFLHVCSENFNTHGIYVHVFGTLCFIIVYAIPGLVVIFSYSLMGRTLCTRRPPFDCGNAERSISFLQGTRIVRERRRLAWILLLLAILFALCWLPYHVLRLLLDFGVIDKRKSVINSLSYCLFLGHANSALNPIVYCFMTRNFRQSVYDVLCQGTNGISRCQIQKNDTVGIPNSGSVRAQNHSQNSHSKKFSRQDLEKEKLSPHIRTSDSNLLACDVMCSSTSSTMSRIQTSCMQKDVDQPVMIHTSDMKTPKKVKQIYTSRHKSSEAIKSNILKTKQDRLSQIFEKEIIIH